MDCNVPLALTAGLSRPEVYISSYLIASLPSDMLEVVVAHERAHVRRRDGMIQFVAHISSLLHFPWARRRLLADLSLACEQACDKRRFSQVESAPISRDLEPIKPTARQVLSKVVSFRFTLP